MSQLSTSSLTMRRIFWLSLPIIISNATVPIQGLIDVAIIGHLDSPDYLSAVGLAGELFSLLFVSFNFLQYATSGLVAQATGAGNIEQLKRVLFRALIIAWGIGAMFIVLQSPMLQLGHWFFAPEGAIAEGFSVYFSVRIFGAPLELANYALLGWFVGQGQAQTILKQQLSISMSNVVFNSVFVLVLDYGVAGVAMGTLCANLIGFGYGVLRVRQTLIIQQQTMFPINWQDILAKNEWMKLLQLNRDIWIRTMILTLSFAWIMRLGAQQGELLLAANVVLLQLLMIASYAIDGVAVTTESLVGRAYGQHDQTLLRHVVKQTTLVSLMIAILISLLYCLVKPWFLIIMTSLDEVIDTAQHYYLFAAFTPIGGVMAYQFDGIMFGLTANHIIRNSMVWVAIGFFPVSYLLAAQFGNTGVWLSVYWLFVLRGGILWWQYQHLTAAKGEII